MQQSSYIRFLYGILASFAFFAIPYLGGKQLHAQTLRADATMPAVDLCGAPQTFTVSIDWGEAACNGGQLTIAMPTDLVYVTNSAASSVGTILGETFVNESTTILSLPNIPAIYPIGTTDITFQAQAKCGYTTGGEISYTLAGCEETQFATSNIINSRFAKLHFPTNQPLIRSGIIGDEITHDITIQNAGDGTITSFTLEPVFGPGLERSDKILPAGWSFDPDTELYTYSGNVIPGTTITFRDTLRIIGCGLSGSEHLLSTYRAYYGCDTECNIGSSLYQTAFTSFDEDDKPLISVSSDVILNIECLDQAYTHTWTIRNNGSNTASAFDLLIGTDGGEAYIDETSFALGNTAITGWTTSVVNIFPAGNPFGNTGKPSQIRLSIPTLEPGQSTTVTFKQFYAAPLTDPAQCQNLPTSFTVANTWYSGSYRSEQICINGEFATYPIESTTTKAAQYYAFSGENIGEVDVVEGHPYMSDFRIDDWIISGEGLDEGAYFEFLIRVSPDLIIPDLTSSEIRLFNGIDYLSIAGYTVMEVPGVGYRVRITSGSDLWPTGSDLNFSGRLWRLQFPLELAHCPNADNDQWYSIQASFNKGGDCPPEQLISFQCQTVALNGRCIPPVCPEGGVLKNIALLKRAIPSIGYVDTDNNGFRDTETFVTDLSSIESRFFIGGDRLEISQAGTVINGTATPTLGWTEGFFSVSVPNHLNAEAVSLSGKVIINRAGVETILSGLPITRSGDTFTISLAGHAYQDGDEIVASLQIIPRRLSGDVELMEFPTDFAMLDGTTPYSCGGDHHATGYYAPVSLFIGTGGSGDVTGCDFQGRSYNISLSVTDRTRQNALFNNEFRQFAVPTETVISVPEGLEMRGFHVMLSNNSIIGSGSYTNTVATGFVPISNATYTITADEWESILEGFKGSSNVGWLDEGYILAIRPIVRPLCDAPSQTQNISVISTLQGTFRVESTDIYWDDTSSGSYTTPPTSLPYNLNNDQLRVSVTQTSVNAFHNEAQWIMSIQSNSTARSFSNVWIGVESASDGLELTNIQPIESPSNPVPVGGALTPVGDVFQIGSIGAGENGARHFFVTGTFDHCNIGSAELAYGWSCYSYPTDVASATCKTVATTLDLQYTPRQAILQTSIVEQPDGTSRPALCEEFEYILRINNAGGEAREISLAISLNGATGLSYVPNSLTVSDQTATLAPLPDTGNITIDPITNNILINIPTTAIPKLGLGEHCYIGLRLKSEGCDFKSGQRVNFSPGGINFCGSPIQDLHGAVSNRIIIQGAPTNEPNLAITSSSTLDLIPSGEPLSLSYDYTLRNTGLGGNPYPATGTTTASGNPSQHVYKFSIKLPENWEFESNPQSLVSPSVANYVGFDPIKGYVFDLVADLPVGGQIQITDARIIYVGSDATSFDCNHSFGDIIETAYSLFTPVSVCDPQVDCQIEHITTENRVALNLTTPIAPTGPTPQNFCETDNPTLSDIYLQQFGSLLWFSDATSILPLPINTTLVHGQTYYAANSLIDGSVCLSNRLPVRTTISAQPVADAGTDQAVYNATSFSLSGTDSNTASRPTSAGVWTVVSTNGALLESQVTINNPTSPNTTINIPQLSAKASATLRWTVTNGACTSTDEVVLTVLIRPIEANDDDFSTNSVNGRNGSSAPSVSVVTSNDLLDGTTPTIGGTGTYAVSLHPGNPGHANLSMNSAGQITVAANTPAGTYTFPYRICEVANSLNCAEAVATIVVTAAEIRAYDNDFRTSHPIVGMSGGNTPSVLPNDRIDGLSFAPSEVTLTPLVTNHTGLEMNADGTITVTSGTQAGDYTYTYRICEVLNPDNCDEAEAFVRVTMALIEAENDGLYTVDGVIGNPNVANALTNDRLNHLPAPLNRIEITVINEATPIDLLNPNTNVPELDETTGVISVPPGTISGSYIIDYQICELLNPTNCATATITVTVPFPQIEASTDTYGPVRGHIDNDYLINILVNDIYNGSTPTLGNITITADPANDTFNGSATGVPGTRPRLDTQTGVVSLPEHTPDGVYTITYQICDVLHPANCDQADIIITVGTSTIDAIDDLYPAINGTTTVSFPSVLGNDLLNEATPQLSVITLIPGISPHANITMNPDGTIAVAEGIPAAVYQYPYEICDNVNPGNCDQAFATIIVSAPVIRTNNDIYGPINGATGMANFGDVFANDSYDGVTVTSAMLTTPYISFSIVQPAQPVRTETPPLLVPVLTSSGQITVPPGTAAGTYHITYTICDEINIGNCHDAIVTIVVTAAPIIANPDPSYSVNGRVGTTFGEPVTDNDLFNNAPVSLNLVTLTPDLSPHPNISMSTTGVIAVQTGTPAGVYTFLYTICEVLNPTNCSTGVATITVTAAEIVANDDDFTRTTIHGRTGGTTGTVLTNDTLDENPVVPIEVRLIPGIPEDSSNNNASAYLTMNPDGTITVHPGTPSDNYTYKYRICEVLNPTNCDDAAAIIFVQKAPILAVNDVLDIRYSLVGATSDKSVLTNDLLSNRPLVEGEFIFRPGTPSDQGLTMNPDGTVYADAGLNPGVYIYPYTICEVLNPTNCDDAVAKITLLAPDLFIPNMFTPNDDQENQYFKIVGLEEYDYLELTVVNRWGNLIFKNDRYDNLWDGKGLNEGTYFYAIRAVLKGGYSQVHKGHVMIKRE